MRYSIVEREDANLIRASSDSGLEASFSEMGAAIVEIRYAGAPMTIAPKDLAFFNSPKDAYFGKTVGRIAGRIENSSLVVDGKTYQLEANEGLTSLHGGKNGISNRRFKSSIKDSDRGLEIIFIYDSPDGEAGYPGEVALTVTYILDKKIPSLRVEYKGVSTTKTWLSLTNHSYFNLGGNNHVGESSLYVRASNVVEMKNGLIPTKNSIPVNGSLDLRHGKFIKEGAMDPKLVATRAHGYDHCFLLDEVEEEKKHAAVLSNASYCMELFTDYKALVVYSDNYPTEGMLLTNGHKEIIHSGIALEAENRPLDYSEMELGPDKPYRHYIEYVFSKKKGR